MTRTRTLLIPPGTMPAIAALCLVFCALRQPVDTGNLQFPASSFRDSIPYDLAAPALTLRLASPELRELSGLSPTERPGEWAAIADERGEIFLLDATGAVTRRVLFQEKGDFEGVESVGQCLYAIKSNGDIFEIGCWEGAKPVVHTYKTALRKSDDVEGLGYDAAHRVLLVACKGDPERDTIRGIFAFDLQSKQLDPKPRYVVSPQEVNRLVPYDPEEKHDFFSPSAVAVHPLTQDIYLISTALKRLVVLDGQSGKIKFAARLDKRILPQPEGISFDATGNLYLGSEGKGGDGLVLRFDMINKK